MTRKHKSYGRTRRFWRVGGCATLSDKYFGRCGQKNVFFFVKLEFEDGRRKKPI